MPIVGAFVRVESDRVGAVSTRLNGLSGVEIFEVPEEGTVGLLIETDTLPEAHNLIANVLPQVPGVMGVWPTYIGLDDEGSQDDPLLQPSHACSPQGER